MHHLLTCSKQSFHLYFRELRTVRITTELDNTMCVCVLYFRLSQQTECPSPSHCCGSISKCFEPERHKTSGCCTGLLSTRKCKLLKWREQLTKSYKEQEARRSKQTYFILLWQRFYKSYYSGWSAASVKRLYYLWLYKNLFSTEKMLIFLIRPSTHFQPVLLFGILSTGQKYVKSWTEMIKHK